MKPALFNLVLYNQDPSHADYFLTLVKEVVQRFPCRILFIRGDARSEKEHFDVKESTLAEGGIECDMIEIFASGTHLEQVALYILPHLAPDLPLYLLWGDDPTKECAILPRLKHYADRLIFESQCGEKLLDFVKNEKRCLFVDMNWARFAGWRDVFSNVFDCEKRLSQLRNAKKVEITYSAPYPVQATYLRSWLGSRLSWKSLEHVEVKAEHQEDIPLGSITQVYVFADDETEFHLLRCPQLPKIVKVHISTPEKCELPYNVPLLSRAHGQTFMKELLFSEPSDHYNEMLESLYDNGCGYAARSRNNSNCR